MAIELPDEVIVQILTFLPAKSLLRWRSVSKSWLNLINSTEFKLMHLHNFNQLNPRYLVHLLDYAVGEQFYDVYFDDEAFTFDDVTQIEYPFECLNICLRIVGCCNGVVCLSDDDDDDTIILWNPSIRRKLTLPLPMFNSKEFQESNFILGFGYDKISDDYKAVRLTYTLLPSIRPQVEVYTVKTGIWREVMFPHNLRCFSIIYSGSQIFFNGCVHWIARDPLTPGVSHYSIMTFDLTTKLFGEIQFPEFSGEKLIHWTVCVVGESLAVIHSSRLNFGSGSRYMVWVMKEYKNPASWTLLYHKQYEEIDLGRPLCLRNNGDMIVELGNTNTIMFNLNKGCYVYLYRKCMEEESECGTYVDRYQDSLALLDVGDSVPNKEAMEALMMIENQGMRL